MNKKSLLLSGSTAVIALAIGILAGRLLFSAPNTREPAAETMAVAEADAGPTAWTCSMHPQIQQPEPGDCPICGMDLIPLEDDSGGDGGPRRMSMSESSRALADIRTTSVKREFPDMEVRLVGKIQFDETREKSLTARFPARIDELFVNFSGIRVQAGDHLARVYSPELLSAQRELLTAHRADPDSSITRAARDKLRLWDLLPEQIDAIIESGVANDTFELKAPIGGVVVQKHVKEGDYLKTGEPLFKIVDLSRLWGYLDAYESDLPWLRYGQDVAFTVEAIPGETFHGRIAFIDPEVDPKTRTIPVRVNVPNAEGRLKPGMFIRAVVAARLAGEGTVYAPDLEGKWISPMHPEVIKDGPGQCDVCGMDLVPAGELGFVENDDVSAPLTVPTSAVLRTGKRAVVYIAVPGTDRPTYEGREIVLGPRAGDTFIVAAGLEEGDRVVTNGAFKIDSALQIQAKPSMMNPGEDKQSMTQHDHDGAGTDETSEAETPDLTPQIAAQLLPDYLAMQDALASDDFTTARSHASAMMETTGHNGPLGGLLHVMLAAETIEGFRKPHFETLSNAFISAVHANPGAFDRDLIVMHCPMVYGDTGADWLQDKEPLLNPYFGAMMLRCGEVRETIAAAEDKHEGHDH